MNYPKSKLEDLVTSDNSTDSTSGIVRKFISQHPNLDLKLYEVKQRKGKTNAQNEAVRIAANEFLVFTDANSILDKNSIRELMSSFTSEDIVYVTARLVYVEDFSSISNLGESSYWDLELKIREIESRIQTITAGNGALYACRSKDYIEIPLIESHDSSFPLYFALQQKRAIANHDAIAFEKTGATVSDEFKRKVRMNRIILKFILPSVKILNVFKMKSFTYFYLGHRTFRYLLWLNHFLLLLTSYLLRGLIFNKVVLILQLFFYIAAILQHFELLNFRVTKLAYYYSMTIYAQIKGVWNIINGKAKPIWDSVESTR